MDLPEETPVEAEAVEEAEEAEEEEEEGDNHNNSRMFCLRQAFE